MEGNGGGREGGRTNETKTNSSRPLPLTLSHQGCKTCRVLVPGPFPQPPPLPLLPSPHAPHPPSSTPLPTVISLSPSRLIPSSAFHLSLSPSHPSPHRSLARSPFPLPSPLPCLNPHPSPPSYPALIPFSPPSPSPPSYPHLTPFSPPSLPLHSRALCNCSAECK